MNKKTWRFLLVPVYRQQLVMGTKMCGLLGCCLLIIRWLIPLSFLPQNYFWQLQVLIAFRIFLLLSIFFKAMDWLNGNLSDACMAFESVFLGGKDNYYWGKLGQWVFEDFLWIANLLCLRLVLILFTERENFAQPMIEFMLLAAQGLFWSVLVFNLLLFFKGKRAIFYAFLLWVSGCLWSDIYLKFDQVVSQPAIKVMLTTFMLFIPRLDLFYQELFPGAVIFCLYCFFYLSLVTGIFIIGWKKSERSERSESIRI